MDVKNELFICECYNAEHQFILNYDEDDNTLSLQVHLRNYRSFFKRLVTGIKYIFGYKSRFGSFDEILINPDDKERLINVVNQLKTK
jgi:hypothetical protein